MSSRPRIYGAMLQRHLELYRQMAFLSGPRQVGKTTLCQAVATAYLSWDDPSQGRLLAKGGEGLASYLEGFREPARPLVAAIDEFHKHRHWKRMLKGFFDVHGAQLQIILTGSSRLDVYQRGGDSLMGRYFHYRMHPFSLAEAQDPGLPPAGLLRPPRPPEAGDWQALWEHGGFPSPFLGRDAEAARAWRRLRRQQLVREDLRDLTRIHELNQMDIFTALLAERSAQLLSYSNLARDTAVSVDTARRWLATLSALHWGFLVRPYSRRIARSLRKEPKWYLRDWSEVADPGQRAETMVACHLLKAVDAWTDLGRGDFELAYLRDTQHREVDFLVLRDKQPWFLVEVKLTGRDLSPHLAHFQKATGAPHAFQAVFDLPFKDYDCFAEHRPANVSLQTLLSQLV